MSRRGIRRNVRMQGARRSRGGGGALLLDYRDATFTRASEASFVDPRQGWAFQAQGAGAWLAADAPRIFSDGAILIEGSRTTEWLDSEDPGTASWLTSGAAGASGTAVAPDGGADAGTVTFAGAATDHAYQAPAFVDGTTVTISAFVRGAGERARLGVRQRDGSTLDLSTDFALTSEWQRVSFTASVGTGVSAPQIRVQNGSDGAARTIDVWGVQVESSAFASSPIRTSGAAATRAHELCVIPSASVPAHMRTAAWAVDFWSPRSSAELAADTLHRFIVNWGGTSKAAGISLRGDGASGAKLALLRDNGALMSDIAVTFSAASKITVTVDVAASTWTLSGLTTGNGTYALATPDEICDGDLSVGGRINNTIQAAFCVVSRPRTA